VSKHILAKIFLVNVVQVAAIGFAANFIRIRFFVLSL